jgi:hypothetical protein
MSNQLSAGDMPPMLVHIYTALTLFSLMADG